MAMSFQMKAKTKTLRVKEEVHRRIKARLAASGVKIEAWVEKTLLAALEQP